MLTSEPRAKATRSTVYRFQEQRRRGDIFRIISENLIDWYNEIGITRETGALNPSRCLLQIRE